MTCVGREVLKHVSLSIRLVIKCQKKESILFICFLSFSRERLWFQSVIKECLRKKIKQVEFDATLLLHSCDTPAEVVCPAVGPPTQE